jgi:catechol 2,3-dioxygenase-like lactoylglutathione lyase family enzyme
MTKRPTFGIGHIVIPVHDMGLALKFYRDTLGFGLVGEESPVWNRVNGGDAELTLFLQAEAPRLAWGKDQDDSPLFLHVADFSIASRFLAEQGFRVKRIDKRQGIVWDPSGNVLGIHDHKEKD